MKERMGNIQTIHFVGIGGVGMAGIAEVLISLGYQVQGSDLKEGKATARLERLGIVRSRAQTIRDLAQAALGGRVSFDGSEDAAEFSAALQATVVDAA